VEEPDAAALRHTVLEAHRTLMAMNERHRDRFRDVVVALEHQEAKLAPEASAREAR
jgi:hypothetical protein